MNECYQIRLTGSGGQGLVTAGIILAEAAIIAGNDAIQSQSYGAEARGGASKSEVLVSTESIAYPKVIRPNILLAMTNKAYSKYGLDVFPETISIIDSYFVNELVDSPGRSYLLPISDTAVDVAGKIIVANIVAVGILAALVDSISNVAAEEAVRKRVPRGTEDMNLRALQAGLGLGEKILHHCKSCSEKSKVEYKDI